MSFPRYPEYKESGVDWLGAVPVNWVVGRLKLFATLITGITPPSDDLSNYADEGWPWVRPEDLDNSGGAVKASKFLTNQGWNYCRPVRADSTLICCIGTIGKLGYTLHEVCTNQQITAAVPNRHGRYLFYCVQAASTELDLRATGNVLRILNTERLGDIKIPMPSYKESEIIAAFLDHETARIDVLIAEQQRLIELLKEKRHAVISHAVTKGLEPDVPMRDSGVEWLGEIPAHWGVWRSKRLFPESKLRSSAEDEQLTASQDWGVITQKEFVHRAGRRVVQINQHFDKRKRVERDDFVISMRSFQGGLERAWTSGGIRSSYVVLKPVGIVNVGYFERLFKSGRYIQALQSTANFIRDGQDLNYQNFCEVDLPLPPEAEQRQIAEHLRSTTETIDALVGNSHASVELLEERRCALISAAVTGKIDVRNWQPVEARSTDEYLQAAEQPATYA